VGVKVGTFFVLNTTQASIDRFVNPQDDSVYDTYLPDVMERRLLPSRALVTLNIRNMFDYISFKRCGEIMEHHLT